MKNHSPEYLERAFRHFAEMCAGKSPLYATLSARVADDRRVYRLASSTQKGQPPVNLLFGAVHYLLFGGTQHRLAEYYPSVGGRRSPERAYSAFADSCDQFERKIIDIVAARRVQTNEVGRCGLLLPAFALAWEHFGRRPLYLIEIGAGAGLNLHFDRYRYEYSNGHVCGPESNVRIRTDLKGDVRCPLPDRMPKVAERIGIDIAPAGLADEVAIRWLASLIWPDQMRRIEMFRHAVARARDAPTHLIKGDGMDLVDDLVTRAPAEALPGVYHSHAIFQMSEARRESFSGQLDDCARSRALAHVSLEWLGDDPGPKLQLSVGPNDESETVHLADCDHHGAWMRWLSGPPIREASRKYERMSRSRLRFSV